MIKKRKIFLDYLPAFSFMLAYFVFQYLISGLSRTVSPIQTIRSLLVFDTLLIICGCILYVIIRDHQKAGLTLLLITELFMVSQAFFIFSGIISIVVVVCWVGILLLRKKAIVLSHISFLLTVLGFGIIAIVVIGKQIPLKVYLSVKPQIIDQQNLELTKPDNPPDIYYIVLDAYARTNILEDLYGFDNTDFTDYLLEKGFIIPTDNHSNYARSELSEASTLNSQYIQDLIINIEGWPHWWLLSPLIENSYVKTQLKGIGYETIAIAVDFENINDDNVDLYFYPLPVQLNSFEKYLIQTSPLRILSPVIEKFSLINTYSSHRRLINYSFEKLSEIPSIEGPKFIYSHITSPHPPFVFAEDGEAIEPFYEYSFFDGSDFPGSKSQYIDGYISQLKYINKKLEEVIDAIIKQSENPPIIIIMSDHGSRLYVDFSDFENSCHSEGYSNFMALYLPDIKPEEIPSDISSVNLFRIIFNNYFSTGFGLLDNKYYYSSNDGVFFRFIEVGSCIGIECNTSK